MSWILIKLTLARRVDKVLVKNKYIFPLQAFQLSVAVFCVAGLAAVAGDFVGLNAEQLARAGRQSDDGAVQARFIFLSFFGKYIC